MNVAYIRVSTHEQADSGAGLAAQRTAVEAYSMMRGMPINRWYEDAGVSGGVYIGNRPAGGELMTLLRRRDRGGIRAVVCAKLDRMFRSAIDAMQTLGDCADLGVAIHVVDMGGASLDSAGATGRFVLSVLASLSEMERGLIAERTSAAMIAMRRRGSSIGPPPYGWRTEPNGDNTPHLVPDPEEQERLRFIMTMRAGGASYWAIAAEVNARGWKPKRGARWYASSVRSVTLSSSDQSSPAVARIAENDNPPTPQ